MSGVKRRKGMSGVKKWLETTLSRLKLYRKFRGGAWYKVTLKAMPSKHMWVREVDPDYEFVWKREDY
ncbi:hypothetical protein [Pseudalkalibacillus caeni]|uniref:Uncharacterized protein n=1 Tax=Exobacillus caeni TaxID=2574798 RepID=A0A5R9FA78_9BACL|nr:hypothetical protein [Pseudalkalibacillus caeni]TLS36555.1 hypothetical protein FCL54_15210 [Pseudalkalibacillus caeni]